MKALPILAVGLLLAGCGHEGYHCEAPGACNPVRHNYRSAVSDSAWSGWQAGNALMIDEDGNFHRPGENGESGERKPLMGASKDKPAAAKSGTALQKSTDDALAGPGYVPPKPWRVWLAPVSRNDGTLQSGSYVWFTTPGHWNYLGKQWKAPPLSASSASSSGVSEDGTLTPIAPGALGFKPGKALAPKGVLEGIQQPNGGS